MIIDSTTYDRLQNIVIIINTTLSSPARYNNIIKNINCIYKRCIITAKYAADNIKMQLLNIILTLNKIIKRKCTDNTYILNILIIVKSYIEKLINKITY